MKDIITIILSSLMLTITSICYPVDANVVKVKVTKPKISKTVQGQTVKGCEEK